MIRIISKPSWAVRRRIVIVTLLWCGLLVTYLALFGRPVSLSETIANGCLLLMASVIGSYVFGAVWDDKNHGATAIIAPPGPAMPEPPGDQS